MRKKSAILVAALLVLSGVASQVRATTNMFVVNLSGHLSGPSTSQRVSAASLVASNNFVMLSLDSVAGTVDVLEGSGSVTNPVVVQVLMASVRSIVTTNGYFIAALLPPKGAPNFTLASGLVFGGALSLVGSFFTDHKGVLQLDADLSGIWNDPINGNAQAASATDIPADSVSVVSVRVWK